MADRGFLCMYVLYLILGGMAGGLEYSVGGTYLSLLSSARHSFRPLTPPRSYGGIADASPASMRAVVRVARGKAVMTHILGRWRRVGSCVSVPWHCRKPPRAEVYCMRERNRENGENRENVETVRSI
jgi:hypothetical protein